MKVVAQSILQNCIKAKQTTGLLLVEVILHFCDLEFGWCQSKICTILLQHYNLLLQNKINL